MSERSPTVTGGRPATSGVIPGRFALSVGNPHDEPPRGWAWTALTDVARLESGHTPSRRHPEYWDGDIPWIGIRDATENHGRVLYDTERHVTQDGIDHSSARVLPANTVCLSRTASIGYVVVMGRPMATSQDFVNWVCGPRIDARFLKYVLLAEREAFAMFASGTTHQTIYFPEVKAFHVCLPPLEEQHRIVGILGALDDKIELNRRTSETLDATARALFDTWFVSGRSPGEDGWRTSFIGDEFKVTMGQSPPGSTYNSTGDGLPFYQGRADFGPRFPSRRVYCTAPTRTAAAGDTLLSVRAPVGDINIAVETCAIGRGVAAIRHRSGSTTYTFEFMGSMRGVLDEYNADGTVFGAIGGKDLSAIPCLAPPDGLVRRFAEQARPLDERLENLERQRQTLTEVRDAMLPRLLRGETSPSFGRGQGA